MSSYVEFYEYLKFYEGKAQDYFIDLVISSYMNAI